MTAYHFFPKYLSRKIYELRYEDLENTLPPPGGVGGKGKASANVIRGEKYVTKEEKKGENIKAKEQNRKNMENGLKRP
jgi:hypothetical protein